MDLTHLRYFLAIAQLGSMTSASKALRVSQPTLTVAIKHLEEELATTLFARSRSGVTLTATGQVLVKHATEVFLLLEDARRRVHGLESGEVGKFVIGCHESLGAYFLPGFMRGFLEQAPRIEVTLWNGASADVQARVVGREVDFGIVVNPLPHPELVLVELFKDAVDLFVSSDEPERSRSAAGERLERGPLIHAGRVDQCRELLGLLASENLVPSRLLSCGDFELVKSLALCGLGVAMLPRRVAAYGQPGKLRRLHPELPFFPDTIFLLFRGDMHRTRGALRLKDALIAHGKGLPDV